MADVETLHPDTDALHRHDELDDNLDIQAAMRPRPAAQAEVPDTNTSTESDPAAPVSHNAFIKVSAGIAGALMATSGIASVAVADANEHAQSETTIASESFTPSLEDGSLYENANKAVDDLLDAHNLSYDTINNDKRIAEVDEAVREYQEKTGLKAVPAGARFVADLTSSTGIVTGKTNSINITPEIASPLRQQDTDTRRVSSNDDAH